MSKTKITVEIHREGIINTDFLKMVAAHNQGTIDATIQHFLGLLIHNKIEYPTTLANANYKTDGETLHITLDNWNTTTLSLTWKEVHELPESEKELPVSEDHGIIVLTV